MPAALRIVERYARSPRLSLLDIEIASLERRLKALQIAAATVPKPSRQILGKIANNAELLAELNIARTQLENHPRI